MAEDINVLPGTKQRGWLKWVLIIAVILAIIWYLNYAGYINLPFF